MSYSPHEIAGCFHGIASSTSALVSKESVNFARVQTSYANCMRTSFASLRFWAGYIRKALIATGLRAHSPRQTSVSPPDATAMLPRLSSPAESTAEVGSRSIALHTFPKVATNLAVCKSTVGYAFAKMMKSRFQERRVGRLDIPDRLCPRISPDLLVLVPGRLATVPCYPTKW